MADLSRGETQALTALAWLEGAEGMLSQGEKVTGLRQQAVGFLETLRHEVDRHENP